MNLVEFQYIMEKLEEKQIPSGFERELIIIGNHAYGVVEKIQQFLGERQVTKEFSKVSVIPEGIFFAKDYAPRILTEGSKILAVEFLKRTGQTKDKVSDDDDSGYITPFPHFPPGSPGAAGSAKRKILPTEMKVNPELEPYCKHCGAELPKGQSICHVWGKRAG